MAIVYDWYKNPNASEEEGEQGLHPRIFLNGKVETKELCELIHQRSSQSVGDVKSTLDTLSQLMGEELTEGRAVYLEGIGYFYPVLQSTQKVTSDTPNKSNKLRLKTIRFRPDRRLKDKVVHARIKQSTQVNHSQKISDAEIDIRLEEYFSEHRLMTRRDFQAICSLACTTAKNHLVRLRQEGKLLNIGMPRQPIYVPAPGYYGVPHDVVQNR